MAYGKIPESAIESVRLHHEIVETVGKYVHLTKNGKYMKGLCPFHSEKTPSFTVTPELQIFHCYGCGKGGDVIRFVAEIEGYSFPEAVRVMAEEAGIPVTWENGPGAAGPRDETRIKQYEAHELAAKLYHYLLNNTTHGQAAKAYLRSRGLSDRLIDEFSIGFAPDSWDTLTRFLQSRKFDLELMEKGGLLSAKNDGSGYLDRFRNRIMFPIRNRDGKVCGFGGRVMDDSQPKYLNSPESSLFAKSRIFYNFHAARPVIRKTRRAVLFEGYMDVIKAWSAGVKNGLATMGTALTEEHAAILQRHIDEAIFCYDGDDAGQAAILKSIPILEKAGLKVSVAMLPKGMDPDECITKLGPERFIRETMEQPVSATKFRLLYLRKDHTLLGEENRKNYVMDALGIVAQLESSTEREVYLKELSREFEISLESLKADCHRLVTEQQKKKPSGDNNDNSWNNGRNEKRRSFTVPAFLPAYHHAERRLLSAMMRDADAARMIYEHLGEDFNVEEHAALAAYLYAYYAQGLDPDVSRFIATLQDDRLERTAASILMNDDHSPFNEKLLGEYIREVRKVPRLKELERMKEEQSRAERSGDTMQALQLGIEIIALEKQLKERPDERF